MLKKTVVAYALGCLTVGAGLLALEVAHHVWRMPRASATAKPMPMTPFDAAAATIKSGQPNFRGTSYAVSSDNRTISGVWAADGPSTFDWSYGSDEAVYINEGKVEIEYLGRKFALGPGEVAFFQAGTKATWTVPQYVRKSWTTHETSPMVTWVRDLLAAARPS